MPPKAGAVWCTCAGTRRRGSGEGHRIGLQVRAAQNALVPAPVTTATLASDRRRTPSTARPAHRSPRVQRIHLRRPVQGDEAHVAVRLVEDIVTHGDGTSDESSTVNRGMPSISPVTRTTAPSGGSRSQPSRFPVRRGPGVEIDQPPTAKASRWGEGAGRAAHHRPGDEPAASGRLDPVERVVASSSGSGRPCPHRPAPHRGQRMTVTDAVRVKKFLPLESSTNPTGGFDWEVGVGLPFG